MKSGWPIWAILLFSVVTDWVQSDWPHAVFRASACVACAAYVAIVRPRLSWALVPIALLAAWGLLQLSLNSTVWRFATWHAVLQWFALGALFYAALQCLELRSQLRWFAWFGGAFSFYATAQYFAWPGTGDKMLGTFLNQNHYSALMELLLPVALWRVLRVKQRDKDRAVLGVCVLFMFVSVAVGGSRAGIVLMLAEVVYLGVRTARKPLIVLGAAAAIAAVAAGAMWTRFEALSTHGPFDSREATARASIQMVRDRLLLGYGLATWPRIYPAYAERDTGFRLIHADNDWLEWAAEGGIPFAAIMLALAAFAVRAAWREPWCAGCVAVMLHSLVEFPLQKQSLWAWFVVLLAMAQNSEIARRKQSS